MSNLTFKSPTTDLVAKKPWKFSNKSVLDYVTCCAALVSPIRLKVASTAEAWFMVKGTKLIVYHMYRSHKVIALDFEEILSSFDFVAYQNLLALVKAENQTDFINYLDDMYSNA